MIKNLRSATHTFESQTVGPSTASPDTAALVFVVYAISLAKLGRKKDAAEFSKMVIKLLVEDGPDEITHALRRLGTGLVLTDIIDRCTTRRRTDW